METETITQDYRLRDIAKGTVALQAHELGMKGQEPLIFCMDAMIRYAKAFRFAYGEKVGNDGFLGDYFKDVITGLRGLLNGDGAVAMERGITTDSKDNGTVERMFWIAMDYAGLTEGDL